MVVSSGGPLEVKRLRYVVTLAQELHFGRAARRHVISEQPFGQHIRKLEREVGVRLFERTSRRVTLTPAGERFVAQASVVLAEVDRLQEVAMNERHADVSTLRLGVLGFGAAGCWFDLRALAVAQCPGLVLEFGELDLADQYDAVRTGRVDVAIAQFVGHLEGLEFEPILSSPRAAVVPRSSQLSDASFLTMSDLENCRWLRLASREPALQRWAGPEGDVGVVTVRQPATIPTAVATTGLISLHASAAALYYQHPDVRYIPTEGAPVEVALVTRSGSQHPGVAAFRRAARALAAHTAAP